MDKWKNKTKLTGFNNQFKELNKMIFFKSL